MQDFLAALCLVLIIEGLLPFASPGAWRQAVAQIANLDDRSLRIAGAVSIVAGLLLLQLVR